MKQIAQMSKNGRIEVVDVPLPILHPNGLLVRTAFSLISSGTERSTIEVARKGLIGKARARPDQVRQVIATAKRIGIGPTYKLVRNRLDTLAAMGYSSAGTVIQIGSEVRGFQPGDLVACAGVGFSSHAEVNFVPKNLCVSAEGVDPRFASFATVGAIALHGVRQADVRIGETVAVVGLGLIGLLTTEILRAAGCTVIGVDPNPSRCEVGKRLGCLDAVTNGEEARSAVARITESIGVDAVLICASTVSSAPIKLGADISRDRGRIIVVGAVGMDVPRSGVYAKELDVRIARSYGPGRYDANYEIRGHDYPIGYVRWTENRNMSAFVQLIRAGALDLAPLVSGVYDVTEAAAAYDLITNKNTPALAVLISYQNTALTEVEQRFPITSQTVHQSTPRRRPGVSIVGAGNFARDVLIPAFQRTGRVDFRFAASNTGLSAFDTAKRYGFSGATTDSQRVILDEATTAIVIATRHDSHAELVTRAVTAGKSVFVEKPLAMSRSELDTIIETVDRHGGFVMVGFNRRFAPLVQKMRAFMGEAGGPYVMHYRVNAGYVPRDHWIQDSKVGGGRIIGEACHFVDLLAHLIGTPAIRVRATAMPDCGRYSDDNVVVDLEYADGSLATLHYLANGSTQYSKERIEVFANGHTAILEDFRYLSLADQKLRRTPWLFAKQDKGHRAEVAAFVGAILEGKSSPVPFEEAVASTITTFRIVDSLKSRTPSLIVTD